MRFPEVTELENDEEQWSLFSLPLKANDKNTLLVSGPPGSGKTVVALYRAQKILQVDRSAMVNLVMYNNTLTKYCENCVDVVCENLADLEVGDGRSRFFVSTWHDWINCWMDECKNTGLDISEWTSSEKRNGRWVKVRDWEAIRRGIKAAQKNNESVPGWNYLIVDEAQDFQPGFHKFVGYMRKWGLCPGVMVLADENQQITEDRSTISDIAKGVFRSLKYVEPDGEHHYLLRSNFRNTRSIALVAEEFYTGVGAERPKLPPESRMGDKPILYDRNWNEIASTVINSTVQIARNSPGKKIGVVTDGVQERQPNHAPSICEELRKKLPGRSISYYKSVEDREDRDRLRDQLDFDSPGAITVLSQNSVKGLEFEAVVCIRSRPVTLDYERQSYVAVYRAREDLVLVSYKGKGFKDKLEGTNTVDLRG